MANIKEIVGKIASITSTQQITKAMKMVAASKLNKVQHKVLQIKPYTENLNSIVSNITASGVTNFAEQYLTQRVVKNILFIVMASDKGLCGSFNANIIKYAMGEVKRIQSLYQEAEVHILPIGEKVFSAFSKKDFKVKKEFIDAIASLSFEKAQSVANFSKKAFLDGEYDRIILVYSNFKSVAVQKPVTLDYLPMVFSDKNSDNGQNIYPKDYIYEPSQVEIMQVLIPKLLETQLYNAMLESSASEHSARMMTMNKATDNAGEILRSLKISYNRTRQAAITQEISEIVSGTEALSK